MASLTTNDIITYAFSGAALLVSVGVLVVSIRLPLYLAKRAERHARLERDREKLLPFYRKVKEFADSFNIEGYQIRDVYDLGNEAGELGLDQFQANLTYLWRTMEKHDTMPPEQRGSRNEQNEYELSPDYLALGKEVQRMVGVIYQMARSETEQLHRYVRSA